MPHLRSRIATIFLVSIVALAACSSDDATTTSGDETTTTQGTETTTTSLPADTTTTTAAVVELRTLSVSHVPVALFAPLYVAIERGYFAEEGLDVKLETVPSGQDSMALVASGVLDASVGGLPTGFFGAVAEGLPVRFIASIGAAPGTTPSPTALIVRKDLYDSGVQTVEDLAGYTIAATGGLSSGGGFNAVAIWEAGGLSIDEVAVVSVSNADMLAALESGAIDAGIVTTPFSTEIVSSGIGVEIAGPPRGFGIGGMLVNSAAIESGAAQGLFNGLARAAADIEREGSNSESISAILAMPEYIGQDIEVLMSSPPYLFSAELTVPQTEWTQRLQESSIRLGFLDLPAPLAVDEYADLEPARQSPYVDF